MWKRSARSLHGCLLTSALLASLALLPSSAWAARDEQKADRGKDKQQTQTEQRAQSRQTQAQPAAPSRASGSGRQPSGSVLTAPAAPDRSARIDRANAAAPVLSRSREIPAPGQTTAPRADPYQIYRAPTRANTGPDRSLRASPVGPSRSAGDESGPAGRLPTSPRVQQPDRRPASEVTLPERGGSPERQLPVGWLPQERGNTREQMPTLVRDPQSGRTPAVNRDTAVTSARPGTGERRLVVPEASFRGPESESKLRVVAPDEGTLAPARLRDWVRQQNRQVGRPDNARPAVDVVGNPVPTDAVLLNRNTISHITINYTKIVNNFGSPGFSYVVAPGAVWGGGYFPRTHHRHTVVVLNLFYPFYYSDPQFVGFYYSGYYPSVYAYFGWSPGWIYPQRVYYVPADYVYRPPTPYRYYGSGYRLDYAGAERAITDVRRAWLDGDTGPLAAHLTNQMDIRVYFDGEYSYSTTTDDFYAMTLDTLSTVRTLAMDFDDPIWISSQEVFYTGRQVFDDPDGQRHTVYVSFRFRKLGAEWYLVAVGTSRDPIQHQYTDFRYSS